MIFVKPGETFEAGAEGFISGLVGTIGFQVLDTPAGTVMVARRTTGISEVPVGSGYYTTTETAPTVEGTYSCFWDTGTISPATTAAEELVVTSSSPVVLVEDPETFITTADLAEFVGATAVSSKGTLAIEAACAFCRTYTGQTFTAGTSTIYVDGTGTDALLLPERPVNNAGTVIENPGQASAGTLTVGTDYKVSGNDVLLRLLSVSDDCGSWIVKNWRQGRQNIQVTYEHGYSTIPGDIKGVALSLAQRFFKQSGGVTFETLGQYSVRYEDASQAFSTVEKIVLDGYKR